MLDYHILFKEKPSFTEEDLKLKWQPLIFTVDCCPYCGGAVGPYGNWEQIDSRPWAQEYRPDGFICYECHTHFSESKIKKAWVKSYSAYELYLYNKMTQEDYSWFAENNIKDIRNWSEE